MAYNDRMWFIGAFCFAAGFLLVFSLVTAGVAVAQNPVPLINQPLVPETIAPGSAGFTLTVNGTGFASGAVVNWNGSARATTFVSGSQLNATILTSDIAKAETASVTVVNPGPGGGTSNVAFFQVTPPSSSIALSAPSGFGAGSGPLSVVVGDFNGDGKLDLAVANGNSNSVSILLGKGDGTFQTHVDYPTGAQPSSVAVGDFNGDGKLDLAIANQNCASPPCAAGSVSILLGKGDGTFEPAMEFSTGPAPYSVAVGDFNGDGKLDLAIANSGPPIPSDISILLGNGDGTFQPAVYYGTGSGTGPASVAVGDFNHDGKLDLAVANFSCGTPCGNVAVLLGNGDGTFQPAVNYNAGKQPISIAIGDFNNDGNLDLAVGNASSSNVSVLLGNGDGTFNAPVNYSVPSDAVSVAVGDFNGDGRPDLVVAAASCRGCTYVSLLLGNGDGTFAAAVNYTAGSNPNSVALGDFNGDGRLDIAVADSGSTTVPVLLQTPIVSLSKTSLTFSNQVVGTSSPSQTVTLTNTGVLKLTISSIAMTGTNATDFRQTNTCGSGLPPGGQCTITVTFAPTQIGPRSASVVITDNAAGSPETVALSGTGVVSGPNVTLSATSLTFATQLVGTTSPTQSVTLSNYGNSALNIATISFTGADPGDFNQANTCGSSVAPGASCTINVTFNPTQRGARTATLSIPDNAPGNPQTVSLGGTGTVVQINPVSLGFGWVTLFKTATLSTTVTNVGSITLSISSIAITGMDTDEFSQTNTCGSTVAAGRSCTVTVTFRPKEGGTDSAVVSISDDGGGSPQQVPLVGAGRPPFW